MEVFSLQWMALGVGAAVVTVATEQTLTSSIPTTNFFFRIRGIEVLLRKPSFTWHNTNKKYSGVTYQRLGTSGVSLSVIGPNIEIL